MRGRNELLLKAAPCRFESWSESKQAYLIEFPDINCSFECSSCGWNPAEQQRRLENGFEVFGETKRVRLRRGNDAS